MRSRSELALQNIPVLYKAKRQQKCSPDAKEEAVDLHSPASSEIKEVTRQ